MSVTFVLPGQLRDLTGGRSSVVVDEDAASVADALAALGRIYPGVRDRILDEQRKVRPHVNLFVGTADIRWTGGLETPVEDGSEVVVLPSVSGG